MKTKMRILICVIYSLDSKTNYRPIGAAFISAILKEKMFNVLNFVWDSSKDSSYNLKKLKQVISQFNIDIVMCGGMITEREILRHIFIAAKELSKSIITIQGGALVSYSPNEAMQLIPECDIGVIGEGEITICELVNAIENQTDIGDVKGIIYSHDHNELKITESQNEAPDLSSLPIPDYEGFFGDWMIDNESFMVSSGRSCNFACTFCSKFGEKYRERPLEKIFEELDYYLPKYKFKRVNFLNEFFNVEESYLNSFCEKIKSYNIEVLIQTRISPKLTLDVLEKLKAAGVRDIIFGLESADDAVLKSMKKGITSELMLKVLKDAKKAQLNVHGNFIFGDVAETTETLQNTFRFIENHRDLFFYAKMFMICLFPGSSLYKKAVSEGIINPLQHIKNGYPLVNMSNLSDEDYAYYKNYYLDYFLSNHIDIDLNITDVRFKHIGKLIFIFSFRCTTCDKEHELKIDPKKTTDSIFKLFCCCGERIALNFIKYLADKDEIIKMLRTEKTAFYGAGSLFRKFFFTCELSKESGYFLLNNSSLMSIFTADISIKVLPPEAIEELNIEKVIVTVSGAYDTDLIISNLRSIYPKTEFMMWYEIGVSSD